MFCSFLDEQVSRYAATPLRKAQMFHATPPRDGFINFHHSSYFFIVAPSRRRVRLKCFTPRRYAAT